MKANVNPTTIGKADKVIASVHHVCRQFELQTSKHVHSDHLPYPSFGKDFEIIFKSIGGAGVFTSFSKATQFLEMWTNEDTGMSRFAQEG